MSYTWLLFDADGTIFDFDAAELQALEWTFQQMGYDFQPDYGAVYRDINFAIWRDLEQGRIQPSDINELRFTRLFDVIGVELHTDLHAFGERRVAPRGIAPGVGHNEGAAPRDDHLAEQTGAVEPGSRACSPSRGTRSSNPGERTWTPEKWKGASAPSTGPGPKAPAIRRTAPEPSSSTEA